MLNGLELLSERDARWTKNVGAIKPGLQKECGLLRDEFPRLYILDLTYRLSLIKSVWEGIVKN